MADIRIYYSVMKNVEVIGEAANMLTRHFRETHTELPWRLIVSMRNVLVHGYAQVSDADLWQTATCAFNLSANRYNITLLTSIGGSGLRAKTPTPRLIMPPTSRPSSQPVV